MEKYLFYFKTGKYHSDLEFQDNNFSLYMWRPSFLRINPFGSSCISFYVWWIFHYINVFKNRDYCICLVHFDRRIIHRALVTPKYFRFPFMDKRDLQIGDVWTDPVFRRKGIASLSISYILSRLGRENRKIWYIVNEKNRPSVHLAEKLGFTLYGLGYRQGRYGIRLLGQYSIYKKFLQ